MLLQSFLTELLPTIGTLLGAFITGWFSIQVAKMEFNPKKSKTAPTGLIGFIRKQSNQEGSKKNIQWNPLVVVLIIIGGLAGFLIGINVENEIFDRIFTVQSVDDDPTEVAQSPEPTETGFEIISTPIQIDFSSKGDGKCNDYNSDLLGYNISDGNGNYYINQGTTSSGYIAICHEDDELEPTGILKVTAYPDKQDPPDDYGFGVLFGWKGSGTSTSDACILGIRKKEGLVQTIFQVVIDGEWKSYTIEQKEIVLNKEEKTLKVVMTEDLNASAYLDEVFIGYFNYKNCNNGPIGMVAFGSEGKNIYFDNLRFSEIAE